MNRVAVMQLKVSNIDEDGGGGGGGGGGSGGVLYVMIIAYCVSNM